MINKSKTEKKDFYEVKGFCGSKQFPLADLEVEKKAVFTSIDEMGQKFKSHDGDKEAFTRLVFATFETNLDQEMYLHSFPQSLPGMLFVAIRYYLYRMFYCCLKNKARMEYYRKAYQLIVEPAPEPEDIIWENLEYGRLARGLRRVGTLIISLILLGISFTIILFLNKESINFAEENPDDYEMKFTISILVSITITIVNMIMNFLLYNLVQFEKPIRITDFDKSHSQKIAAFSFINASIIPMAVNYINDKWEDKTILINDMFVIFISNAFVSPTLYLLDLGRILKWWYRLKLKWYFNGPNDSSISQQQAKESSVNQNSGEH